MFRALCSEPHSYRPWEVARLTPFQAKRILLCERNKDGTVVLDMPLGPPEELTIEGEWRDHWTKAGVSDPDALDLLSESAG